ncbi:MAG: hypothetical protein ACRCX2_13110, partial [Paraclostridium sp.]
CVEDGWTKTIKGKTYICLKEYADGSCQTRAKDGQTYTSNKTLFRLASDLIEESSESKLQEEYDALKKKYDELLEKYALAMEVNGLQEIIDERIKQIRKE